MLSKIEAMVRMRVESEMATKMTERLHESQSTSVVVKDASDLDLDQLPLMAVLTSPDFLTIDAIEGKKVVIEFTVENRSTQAWPFKPFVQNEKDKSIKQMVDVQLAPGQSTTVKYTFQAPLREEHKTVPLLLTLVDPKKYEKFCSETIFVTCNIKCNKPEPLFDLGDMDIEDDSGLAFDQEEESKTRN